jgi:hypothetical protein
MVESKLKSEEPKPKERQVGLLLLLCRESGQNPLDLCFLTSFILKELKTKKW